MNQQINLFNPIFRKQKKYFSAATMAQALGLIAAGCALLATYTNYQVAELNKEAAASTARLTATQASLAKINESYGKRAKSKKLDDDVKKAEAELQSLQQVADVLKTGEFGNTEGYAEYFRAFARQIGNGIWLTGLDIHGAGSDISIQGRTLQPEFVPAYLNRLKKEPVLQGKSFAALEMLSASEKQEKKAAIPVKSTEPASASAGYIEFVLKSAGMATKLPDPFGARKQ